LLSPTFLQRQVLDKHCEKHRVQYRKVMECNSVPMTVQAACDGQGAATLLASVVRNHPGIVGLSFKPRFEFTFELCWRKDRYFSKANQAFVAFARSADANR
jgi:DNA-binding transcriptional LysR family regulator